MAFDETLADRVREVLLRLSESGTLSAGKPHLEEKRMFGGVCFLLNGHMGCGIVGDRLMLRLGEEGASRALDEPHVVPMDFTGKPLKSMVYVEPEGIRTAAGLGKWVRRAAAFAASQPPKVKKHPPQAKRKLALKKAAIQK